MVTVSVVFIDITGQIRNCTGVLSINLTIVSQYGVTYPGNMTHFAVLSVSV